MSLTTGSVTDPIGEFPAEAALEIFSYLDAADLGTCCRVSRTWRRIASDDALWREIFPGYHFPVEKNIKPFLDEQVLSKHLITSGEQLEQCIKKFINNIKQSGTFTCSFLSLKENKNFGIKIKFKTGSNNTQNNPSEQYLYLDKNEQDSRQISDRKQSSTRNDIRRVKKHMNVELPSSIHWQSVIGIEAAVDAKFDQLVRRESLAQLVNRNSERKRYFYRIAVITTFVATIALAYYFNAE